MVKKERAKEKVMVYPYSAQFAPVLRNRELIEQYEITGLVAPYGWGPAGRDAAWADGGEYIGIEVSDSFDEALKVCDAVLLAESIYKLDYSIMRPNIEKAVKAGKNIICTMQLEDELYNNIEKLCIDNNTAIKYYNVLKRPSKISDFRDSLDCTEKRDNHKIYDIETPVLFVAGLAERTNKFQIQLDLRNNLQKLGYKVSQVGSRSYCELMGFHSIPSFMFEPSIPEHKKILLFNWFVKRIECAEKPDIIIIGIPDGIMPLNKSFTGHFGVMGYLISRAVNADALILSVLYNMYNNQYFELLQNSIKYKLGCSITCFNMSNISFDWTTSKEKSKEYYTTIDYRFIDEKIEQYKVLSTPVYNMQNPSSAYDMTNYIIDVLSGYGDIDAI